MASSLLMMGDEQEKSKVDDQIDQSLKRVYSELLDEEVPDRFKELLQQLRQKGSEK